MPGCQQAFVLLRGMVHVSSHSEENVSHPSELIKMERVCDLDHAAGLLGSSKLGLILLDSFGRICQSPLFGNASPSPSQGKARTAMLSCFLVLPERLMGRCLTQVESIHFTLENMNEPNAL